MRRTIAVSGAAGTDASDPRSTEITMRTNIRVDDGWEIHENKFSVVGR